MVIILGFFNESTYINKPTLKNINNSTREGPSIELASIACAASEIGYVVALSRCNDWDNIKSDHLKKNEFSVDESMIKEYERLEIKAKNNQIS
ncbi:hypothetical protein Glove_236g52 [Diversispora epigaea]|uniref:Uncharacterized protein n=1 Tax=Diversispora epigaea TaxID=1348612 RepID=A0A397IGJ1_9GLOM|nr:hypothetical protein Glove_236g52 [Diversispora epigaea]